MHGVTGLLIKLGVRLVVFTGGFIAAAKYIQGVTVTRKLAYPALGFLFALLSTVFYWALSPLLDLATLNALSFAMPLVVNLVLLIATIKISNRVAERAAAKAPPPQVKKGEKPAPRPQGWLRTNGFFASMWLALALTAAHGVLWFALDYLPEKM